MSSFGLTFKKNLDRLNISNSIKSSGKTFANQGGTADRIIGQGIIFGGVSEVLLRLFAMIGLPLVIGGSSDCHLVND